MSKERLKKIKKIKEESLESLRRTEKAKSENQSSDKLLDELEERLEG